MSAAPAWRERPREEANLLNPAFLGLMIDRTAAGYREAVDQGLPWALIYLALPAVLHKETREALPANMRTPMAGWTQANPLLVEGLAERAPTLRALITEALLFSLSHGLVRREDATLEPGGRARRKRGEPWREPTEDFSACATRAAFFGRWCAVSGTAATIFALWGLRP